MGKGGGLREWKEKSPAGIGRGGCNREECNVNIPYSVGRRALSTYSALGSKNIHMNRHVPDLRGNVFSFSLLTVVLAVGLSYMAFVILRYVLSMPTFWRVFFFFSS